MADFRVHQEGEHEVGDGSCSPRPVEQRAKDIEVRDRLVQAELLRHAQGLFQGQHLDAVLLHLLATTGSSYFPKISASASLTFTSP